MNVYGDGSVCVDLLEYNWSPSTSVRDVLMCLQTLLKEPNPESPANVEPVMPYKESRPEYDRLVRQHVLQFHMPQAHVWGASGHGGRAQGTGGHGGTLTTVTTLTDQPASAAGGAPAASSGSGDIMVLDGGGDEAEPPHHPQDGSKERTTPLLPPARTNDDDDFEIIID